MGLDLLGFIGFEVSGDHVQEFGGAYASVEAGGGAGAVVGAVLRVDRGAVFGPIDFNQQAARVVHVAALADGEDGDFDVGKVTAIAALKEVCAGVVLAGPLPLGQAKAGKGAVPFAVVKPEQAFAGAIEGFKRQRQPLAPGIGVLRHVAKVAAQRVFENVVDDADKAPALCVLHQQQLAVGTGALRHLRSGALRHGQVGAGHDQQHLGLQSRAVCQFDASGGADLHHGNASSTLPCVNSCESERASAAWLERACPGICA